MFRKLLFFVIFSTFLVVPIICNQCHLCDSFSGYCEFDGNVCVGAKCSRRFAPTSSGLIREQRLCVPSDSIIGCRKAILWDEMEGTECVCDGHMCNFAAKRLSVVFVLGIFAMFF